MAKRKKLTLTQRVELLEQRMDARVFPKAAEFATADCPEITAEEIRAALANARDWWQISVPPEPLPWYMRGSEYDRRRRG